MTLASAPTAPPIVLTWLANDVRRPAALGVWVIDFTPTDWEALQNDAVLSALCGAIPCYLANDLSHTENTPHPPLQTLAAAQWLQAPDTFPASVAPDQWVSGNWYLQAPASLVAAQAASRARALQLLALVNADADTHDIEALLRQDATLSYQLLRVVNSVALGGRREITSFAQAILLMGRQQLRRWLHLMLFAARDDDPRSAMLGAHVTLRARSLELLAEALGWDRAAQDLAFMAGMFSMLGALFGQPLDQVLKPLNLSDDVQHAVLAHEGALGQCLALVQTAETPGNTTAMAQHLTALGLAPQTFNTLRLQAAQWALHMTQAPAP